MAKLYAWKCVFDTISVNEISYEFLYTTQEIVGSDKISIVDSESNQINGTVVVRDYTYGNGNLYLKEIVEDTPIIYIENSPIYNLACVRAPENDIEDPPKYISNIEIDGENYLIKDSSIEEQLTNKVDINSKVIDGQWVNKPIVLSTSTATGTYNLDLSSYLPNDNYKYDVIFNIKGFRNAVGSSYVYFYTNTINTPTEQGYNILDIGEYSRGASNRFIYPIDIDRQVKLVITTNAMLELSLTAIAYRRLGTNE